MPASQICCADSFTDVASALCCRPFSVDVGAALLLPLPVRLLAVLSAGLALAPLAVLWIFLTMMFPRCGVTGVLANIGFTPGERSLIP